MKERVFLREGHHYDAHYSNFVEDIPFYIDLVREYGDPVLELACGTGRISIPLAREGMMVTGLDLSSSMLERGKKKAKEEGLSITWQQGDCREFSFNTRFKTILFPFNSLALLLHFKDLEDCFSSVKGHLAVGGKFIVALFNPSLTILSRDSEVYYHHASYEDPRGQGEVVVKERTRYDSMTQISATQLSYALAGEEWEETLSMRIYYPEELMALLYYNGFSVEHRFGDFDKSPFTSSSPYQLIVATSR